MHRQEIDNDIHDVLMRFIRYVDKTLHNTGTVVIGNFGILAASIQNIT